MRVHRFTKFDIICAIELAVDFDKRLHILSACEALRS